MGAGLRHGRVPRREHRRHAAVGAWAFGRRRRCGGRSRGSRRASGLPARARCRRRRRLGDGRRVLRAQRRMVRHHRLQHLPRTAAVPGRGRPSGVGRFAGPGLSTARPHRGRGFGHLDRLRLEHRWPPDLAGDARGDRARDQLHRHRPGLRRDRLGAAHRRGARGRARPGLPRDEVLSADRTPRPGGLRRRVHGSGRGQPRPLADGSRRPGAHPLVRQCRAAPRRERPRGLRPAPRAGQGALPRRLDPHAEPGGGRERRDRQRSLRRDDARLPPRRLAERLQARSSTVRRERRTWASSR